MQHLHRRIQVFSHHWLGFYSLIAICTPSNNKSGWAFTVKLVLVIYSAALTLFISIWLLLKQFKFKLVFFCVYLTFSHSPDCRTPKGFLAHIFFRFIFFCWFWAFVAKFDTWKYQTPTLYLTAKWWTLMDRNSSQYNIFIVSCYWRNIYCYI